MTKMPHRPLISIYRIIQFIVAHSLHYVAYSKSTPNFFLEIIHATDFKKSIENL